MSSRNLKWQKYKSQKSLFSRFLLSLTVNRVYAIREDFATRYLSDTGYEIGAQKSPLKCKNAKKIVYIDYLSKEESSLKYDISAEECVDVDIIADANHLEHFPSESTSFIIANHVLEHCPNPIGTMQGWLRILRNNGKLFLTLPNALSNEFDFQRTPVTVKHLSDDFKKASKGEDITTEHIIEHIQAVDGITRSTNNFSKRFNQILQGGLHPHYHVFSKTNAMELIKLVNQQCPIRIRSHLACNSSFELLYIIEKISHENKLETINFGQDRYFTMFVFIKQTILYIFGRPLRTILFNLMFRKKR